MTWGDEQDERTDNSERMSLRSSSEDSRSTYAPTSELVSTIFHFTYNIHTSGIKRSKKRRTHMFHSHNLPRSLLNRFIHHAERSAAQLLEHLISIGQGVAVCRILLDLEVVVHGGFGTVRGFREGGYERHFGGGEGLVVGGFEGMRRGEVRWRGCEGYERVVRWFICRGRVRIALELQMLYCRKRMRRGKDINLSDEHRNRNAPNNMQAVLMVVVVVQCMHQRSKKGRPGDGLKMIYEHQVMS